MIEIINLHWFLMLIRIWRIRLSYFHNNIIGLSGGTITEWIMSSQKYIFFIHDEKCILWVFKMIKR